MPAVFTPGETEVRPLRPDEVVYTTAQKIANLLEIGYPEPVAVSANSESTGVYVTGSDYRNSGFSTGDSILVYSDDIAMGRTHTITAISEGGSSGAKLEHSSDVITFTTASYNNSTTITSLGVDLTSKLRVGMAVSGTGIPDGATIASITTKYIFELSASTTGGALSSQELTFSYTPFLTTAKNTYVQNQSSFTNRTGHGVTRGKVEELILRAQDIIDNKTHNAWRPYLVVGEYINFDTYKPYRRRYYTDYVGTAPLMFQNTQQLLRVELWQGDDYREVGAAEARVKIIDHSQLGSSQIFLCPGGGGIFSLPAATSASANAMGSWITQFDAVATAYQLAHLINKDAQSGKSAKSADTSYDLEDSSTSTGLRAMNVSDEFLATANADYGGGIVKITSMRHADSGETCSIASTDLTNLSISQIKEETTTSTSVSSDTVNVASTDGFAPYGLVMVGTGNNIEVMSYTGKTATSFTGCLNKSGSPLTTLNTGGTALYQYLLRIDYQGGSSVGDHARLRDLWLDHQDGIIFFNNSYPFFEWNAIKASYIYGERYLEKAIQDVCTKMVAIELLMSDDRSVLIPEGTQNVDLTSKIQLWQRDIDTTLGRYRQMVVFD